MPSRKRLGGILLAAVLAGCASSPAQRGPILATVPLGQVEWVGDLPILRLSGSPYEIGYQHGSMMRESVRRSAANLSAFADRQSKIPLLGKWMARRRLDAAWERMSPFVPGDYLQELEGLADGAGIPLETLERIHALPELTPVSCASFAAFGRATEGGKLIQIRNLDWAIQSDVQRYAAVFVVRPAGKKAWVSFGWLGFIGALSGINEEGISVAEIGAVTTDASLEGIPMPFLLRQVLDSAGDLDQAASLVSRSPRTAGYHYLFADAKRKQAIALETTRGRFALHRADQEPGNPFALPVANAIFRSDALVGQALLLKRFHGRINPEIAMAIARAIAPESNIQSVVYAYPEVWVANARERRPAAQGKYIRLDLEELLN